MTRHNDKSTTPWSEFTPISPCPPWCRTDHQQEDLLGAREHVSDIDAVPVIAAAHRQEPRLLPEAADCVVGVVDTGTDLFICCQLDATRGLSLTQESWERLVPHIGAALELAKLRPEDDTYTPAPPP